jgi:AraC-like DNA-binding protein
MSISVVVLRALVEAVAGTGQDTRKFLGEAGFDPRRLDDVDGRIPQAEYDFLVERALDFTGDPALGLRMGAKAWSLTHSLPVHVVFQAGSIREALKIAAQFYRLFTDERPWVVEDGAHASVIKVIGATGSPRCRQFGSDVAVSALYRMVQHFVPDARPDWVAFEHAAPPYRDEYGRIFQGTERFEQAFTGVVVDRSLMDARPLHSDHELHAALQMQAAKRLAQLEQGASFAEKVREYVTTDPERGRDMSSLSRALGVSPRSLRRRLSAEGMTFRDVVERAMASVAIRLLVDEQKTIQEAAHALSFSEPSAFCRAFKRWTGATPTQYQAAHPNAPVGRRH